MAPDNEIAFHFPPNQTYKFEINEIRETQSTIGKEYTTIDTFSTQLNLEYRTLNSIKQDYNVLVRFNKANESINIQGAENDKSHLSPFQQSYKAFDGAKFDVALAPGGEVAGITGYEDFKKKFTKIYNAAVAADELESQHPSHVTPVIEKNLLLNIFDQISNTLCGKSVAIGSTWENMVAEEIGAERVIKNIYKLDKIENGIAFISSTNDHIEKVIKYHDTTMVLQGAIQGEYELEVATGILIKGKRYLNISGNTKLMHGTDFGMTVRKTITIDGKRVSEIER